MVLPRTVSHYEVQEPIGQGGMGAVYRAIDVRLGRTVAIKFQNSEFLSRTDARERFRNEGRTLSALNHPNIATIYEAGEEGGRPFLVMEYLPGGTLKERLRTLSVQGQPPGIGQVIRWCLSLARALDYVHRHGVLHRDVKTSNAMFDEEDRLKLTGFGLAKASGADITRSATITGTFAYMAPELLTGSHPSTGTDLYSLGITFYEIATGELPFSDGSQATLIHKVPHEAPAPLESKRHGLPQPFVDLVERMVAKHPEDRPASAHEVVSELVHLLQAEEPGITETLPEVAPPPNQCWLRSPAITAGALLLALAWLAV
jgi:serine/threonine-protein kinase